MSCKADLLLKPKTCSRGIERNDAETNDTNLVLMIHLYPLVGTFHSAVVAKTQSTLQKIVYKTEHWLQLNSHCYHLTSHPFAPIVVIASFT